MCLNGVLHSVALIDLNFPFFTATKSARAEARISLLSAVYVINVGRVKNNEPFCASMAPSTGE